MEFRKECSSIPITQNSYGLRAFMFNLKLVYGSDWLIQNIIGFGFEET